MFNAQCSMFNGKEGPEGPLLVHAAGNTQAGSNGSKDSHNCLNNKFPSFFFHFCNSLLLKVRSLTPRPLRGEGAEVMRTLLNC